MAAVMTVRSIAVRVLLSDLAKRGIPVSTALSGTALEGLDLSAEGRVDADLFDDLLARAVTLTGDPAFGLTWARDANPADWGLLYQLSAVASTFVEAMASAVRHMPAYSNRAAFALHELPDLFVVEFLTQARTLTELRAKSEFAMRLIWQMFCGFVGPDARAHRVGFGYPAPPYRDEYDRAFRSAVAFDQDATVLEFPMALAQRRQPHEDTVLRNILQARAQVRLVAETPWASRVASYLDGASPELLPDISETARHLGMSERGLRRRLEAEGRSFSSLADDVRARAGIRWLTESETPIKEIAYKLGFSRASAFERAFKRWTGSTPGACRATRSAAGSVEARRPAR
jgi:AraC-like DNA-binding protein